MRYGECEKHGEIFEQEIGLDVLIHNGNIVAFTVRDCAHDYAYEANLLDEDSEYLEGVEVLYCTVTAKEYLDEGDAAAYAAVLTDGLSGRPLIYYRKEVKSMEYQNLYVNF